MADARTTKDFRLKWEGRRIGKQDLWEAIADLLYIIENLEAKQITVSQQSAAASARGTNLLQQLQRAAAAAALKGDA